MGVNRILAKSLKERSEAHSLTVSTVGHAEDTFATLVSDKPHWRAFFCVKNPGILDASESSRLDGK